jgi:alkylation response protein AidB-like acyl-CoA dehydrogenase
MATTGRDLHPSRTDAQFPLTMPSPPESHAARPSTATTGFIQTPPTLPPAFPTDAALTRAFDAYLSPETQQQTESLLCDFSRKVISPQVGAYVTEAEANPPHLTRGFDVWGNATPAHQHMVTSEGWRKLKEVGVEAGILAIPYEGRYGAQSRTVQSFLILLFAGSAANANCPEAMSDGAAALLKEALARGNGDRLREGREAIQAAFDRLTTRDPSHVWRAGQWMTERSGGSDVRGTETLATPLANGVGGRDSAGSKLGPWEVNGFKFFSSSTDADMSIFLARTPTEDGKGELSAFFAPLRRRQGAGNDPETVESNGVRIHRLKNKLGTKPLPTAELALERCRGWLIGKPGGGTRVMGTLLNITRLHTAIGSLGYWGRGLAVARAYADVREIGGKIMAGQRLGGYKLRDLPPHVKGLAAITLDYTAGVHLGIFAGSMLGLLENAATYTASEATPLALQPLDAATAGLLYRLLAPVIKTSCSRRAVAGLRLCMEALGGVGYLEDCPALLSVPRLFRDAVINPIWEGTADVLAADVVRVLKGRTGAATLAALTAWVDASLAGTTLPAEAAVVRAELDRLAADIAPAKEAELRFHGIALIDDLAWIVSAALLLLDARRDGDAIATELARRWVAQRAPELERERRRERGWKAEAAWNTRIVFGEPATASVEAKL